MSLRFSPSAIMRVRHHQPTRLEGFVDTSFAFAVTLLVISIGHVPESVPEMLQALRGVPTFAVCFALIACIWRSHRDWSRYYDVEDTPSILLGLTLVFLVLVYVYPLRLLFSLMFAGASDRLLMEQTVRLSSAFELRVAYIVFSAGYVLIWIVFAFLYRHAWRLRETIGLDAAECVTTCYRVRLFLACGAIGMTSIVLAATLPFRDWPWAAQLPGSIYLLLFPVTWLLRRSAQRNIGTLPADRA